jgi:hypothetical protein
MVVEPVHKDTMRVHLSISKTLQKIGFAGAVGADEAISASNGQLDGAILYELNPVQAHAEAINFDVSGGRPRGEDACDRSL